MYRKTCWRDVRPKNGKRVFDDYVDVLSWIWKRGKFCDNGRNVTGFINTKIPKHVVLRKK